MITEPTEPGVQAWAVPDFLFATGDDIVCDGCAQVLWFLYPNGDIWMAQNEEGLSYPIEPLTAADFEPGTTCGACGIDLPKKEQAQ
jgi:hypothetical protein